LRLLSILLILPTLLFAKTPADDKRILVSQIDEDKYRMRVYLNFENPYKTVETIYAQVSEYTVVLPIADRFEVLSMNGYFQYTSSISLKSDVSTISIIVNDNIVNQFKLNGGTNSGGVSTIAGNIPLDKIYSYNHIGVRLLQASPSASSGSSGSSCDFGANDSIDDFSFSVSPDVWTQLDLHNSYIEFEFKLKPVEERISQFYEFLFDNKNLTNSRVNLVFPEIPDDTDINNYGFFSSVVGYIMGFKDIDFSVSTDIVNDKNNVVLMLEDDVKKLFDKYNRDNNSTSTQLNFDEKVNGNINMIANPVRPDRGIFVVTGKSMKDISSSLYRLTDEDVKLIEEQYIRVFEREAPKKAKPFSAPKFTPLGTKIYLSDLGYKDKTFYGQQVEDVNLEFMIYPTHRFSLANQDKLEFNFNLVSPNSNGQFVIVNSYLNNQFAYQMRTASLKGKSFNQHFENAGRNYADPYIINLGRNILKFNLAMTQGGDAGGASCTQNFVAQILQTTVKNDSYFILPKGTPHIELPELKYIAEVSFPFSIYGDLQNTGILITDFNADTIAAAMQVAFQLGKNIGQPGYYLTTTYDINKILDKDIIVLGGQIERYAPLYKNAPIRFTKDGIERRATIQKNFKDGNSEEKSKVTKTIEAVNFDEYLFVQSYRSPFNPKRVILEISAKSPDTLIAGVQQGLLPKNMGNFEGDVWLYNIETEQSSSYRLGEQYILEELVEGYGQKKFDDEKYHDIDYF
jgi:hypothetical protein